MSSAADIYQVCVDFLCTVKLVGSSRLYSITWYSHVSPPFLCKSSSPNPFFLLKHHFMEIWNTFSIMVEPRDVWRENGGMFTVWDASDE